MHLRIINGGKEVRAAVAKDKLTKGAVRVASEDVLGIGLADYIWMNQGEFQVKKKPIVVVQDMNPDNPEGIPQVTDPWTFKVRVEGDLTPRTYFLCPVHYLPDPTRDAPSFVVLCEVRNDEEKLIGTRPQLREMLNEVGGREDNDKFETRWGFKQGYQLYRTDDKAVDNKKARLIQERHLAVCIDAGVMIQSVFQNTPTTGFFKVGERGFPDAIDPDPASALITTDHLMLARYFLHKVALDEGYSVEFQEPKVYVSTLQMRLQDIETQRVVDAMRKAHPTWVVHAHVAASTSTPCLWAAKFGTLDPYRVAREVLSALKHMESV